VPDSKYDTRILKHLLVSASYSGARHLCQAEVMDGIRAVVEAGGLELSAGRSWSTAHFIHPQHGSLLDAWTSLADADRADVKDRYPRLYTAIYLACKGTVPEPKRCGSVSGNGSACVLRGPHSAHQGPTDNPTCSSEVWVGA
jgi:hypothetical protein